MADYITVDGGTTNTRISLVSNNKVIDILKFNIGARKGIDDNNALRLTVRDGISQILERSKLKAADITAILASGMITSEFGLINLPHITAPAGPKELNSAMHRVVLEDISEIPFVFIRGVKTLVDSLENADMMRGEETELAGVFQGEGVYILPGSHSKIISADKQGRITDFKTMLTGEMIAALSQNTILKSAVDMSCSEINGEYLLKGCRYCEKSGINEALFKVRILKNIFEKSNSEVYSFFMGVILCDEIKYILSQNPAKIIIGGKLQIKQAMHILLESLCETEVIAVSEEEVKDSSALGAVKIYEYIDCF